MSALGVSTLLALSATGEAAAQSDEAKGFAIDRFDPSERGSEWFVLDTLDFRGKLRPAVGAVADYAHKPLVFYDANGDEARALVKHQLFLHLGGSLVIADRFRVAASLPVAVVVKGEGGSIGTTQYPVNTGGNVGDLRLSGDVRVLGEYRSPLSLAVGASLWLPTGDRGAYTGDGKVRIAPHANLAGELGMFAYAAKLGINVRLQDGELAGSKLGSEVFLAGSAGLRLLDGKLLVGPELYTSTVMQGGLFRRRGTPFEGILGAHYWIKDQVRVGAGVGPGFTDGFGSPKVRAVASLEWVPGIPKKPDDRDGDGILDGADACPDEPGVASDDPAKNGCPVRDRDGDGILDDVDACPDEPGVASDNPAKNGCPVRDRDGDSIVDGEDACPDVAGPRSDDPAKNGCPPARIENGQIRILEQVRFKTNSAEILPASTDILNAVKDILVSHTEINQVGIEGHTDNVGKPAYNKSLSQKRAASVANWLIIHGVDRARLTSAGFGLERPLADNETETGRTTNRRVEFHIRVVNGKPATSDERVSE